MIKFYYMEPFRCKCMTCGQVWYHIKYFNDDIEKGDIEFRLSHAYYQNVTFEFRHSDGRCASRSNVRFNFGHLEESELRTYPAWQFPVPWPSLEFWENAKEENNWKIIQSPDSK